MLQGAVAGWEGTIWERMLAASLGNWIVAGLVGLALIVPAVVPALKRYLPTPGTAFWIGVAIGVAPLLSAFTLSRPLLALGGLAALAAAWFLGGRIGPAGKAIFGLAVLVVAVTAVGAVFAVTPKEPEKEEFDPLVFQPRNDSAPQGPDVLLISIDTLRADAIVGERPPGYELPTFDRLREEGLWADYAYSPSNQTLPGHLGMLTGLDAMEIGVRYNYDPMPADLVLLSQRFREAGYRTGGVISNPLIAGGIGFHRGFEVYDDSKVVQRSAVRDFADGVDPHTWLGWTFSTHSLLRILDLTVMRGHKKAQTGGGGKVKARGRAKVTNKQVYRLLDQLYQDERPYFLFAHYMDAHAPYGPPDPWMGKLTAQLPPLDERYQTNKPSGQYSFEEIDKAQADLQDPATNPERRKAAEEAVRFLECVYLEEVLWLDHCIGELLARIEESGRPTIVLITSDHGEHFGEHNLLTHANSLFEENLRVPFLLWGPGVGPGKVETGQVDLIDVAPTLLDLTGILSTDAKLPGVPVHRGVPEDRTHVAVDEKRFGVIQGAKKWIARWSKDGMPQGIGLFVLGDRGAGYDEMEGDAAEPPPDLIQAVEDALTRDKYVGGGDISEERRNLINEAGYVDDAEADLEEEEE